MEYPVVEMFESVQGEGLYAGTRMFFIRFAGCCVGRPTQIMHQTQGHKWVQHICKSWDGREFKCDTDFKVRDKMSANLIASCIPPTIDHLCLTGGEPLIHNLADLLAAIDDSRERPLMVHIETSGVKNWHKHDEVFDKLTFWVTVSPKFNCLPEMVRCADEIKILVDRYFKLESMQGPVGDAIAEHKLVYLQPVNFVNRVDGKNIRRCVELQKLFPNWRISLQLHKIMRVR